MARGGVRRCLLVFLTVLGVELLIAGLAVAAEPEKIVQAGATLTVAESKRLIGKAVAQMPIVKNALANGMVIVMGGGLSNIARLYREVPLRLGAYVFSDTVSTPILPARHGDSSGVRGAAWLWPLRA